MMRKRRAGDSPKAADEANVAQLGGAVAQISSAVWVLSYPTSSLKMKFDAVVEIRRVLSAPEPPVDHVVQAGAIPHLASFLNETVEPKLIVEATWALTNIASSHRTRDVAQQAGLVQSLVSLLAHPAFDVRGQAIWCLGNIAGEGEDYRDALLNTAGFLDGLVKNLLCPINVDVSANVMWAASNLIRGKKTPVRLEQVAALVPPMVVTLQFLIDCQEAKEKFVTSLTVDSAWAFSYLTELGKDAIEATVNAGAVAPLLKLLTEHIDQKAIVSPLVRAIGNIIASTIEMHTQDVLDAGFVNDHVMTLLTWNSVSWRVLNTG
jgi:importin subunit alpha-6/7